MPRILLVHGLGGTAGTMQPLAEGLAAAGHTVHAPTLPGHGTVPEALVGVGWSDWMRAAQEWRADVIIGQSMGAALALTVASHHGCRAVVAINPPTPNPDDVDGLEWRQSRGHGWVDGPPLADGEVGYTRFPITALLAMANGVLAIDFDAVTCPVLLVTSALDEVVDPAGADVVAVAVTGAVVRLMLPHSGHVATLGPDLDRLLPAVVGFIDGFIASDLTKHDHAVEGSGGEAAGHS